MYPSISDSAPPPPMMTAKGIPVNPQATNVDYHPPGPWSTGLCCCFEDITSCCLTCWCPCVTFGRIAEIVDRGSTACGISGGLYGMMMCMMGCSCLYSCFYRTKLRGQHSLEEKPCADFCVHFCCEQCALCQEYRELKNRGFDMSIGWHGNMARQKRLAPAAAQAPSIEGGMTR